MIYASGLSLACAALFAQAPAARWTQVVRSDSGRYEAELAARGAQPAPGEKLELVVRELREGREPARFWTGALAHDLAPDALWRAFLTDDGAAFVRIVERPARGAVVRAVVKGSPAAALQAEDLALAVSEDQPWIAWAASTRWRPNPDGLNVRWSFDLLGLDGLVRTLDLDRGTAFVHHDPAAGLPIEVHPPVPELVRPATHLTAVDEVEFPSLAYAGGTFEIEGHGHSPSAGYRFIGFELVGDPRTHQKLVLVPRAVPPKAAAAAAIERHLWTARVRGLPPGTYQVELCGSETNEGDARRDPALRQPAGRTVELVSPAQLAEFRSEAPVEPGALRRAALFADGRLELDFGAGPRAVLATMEEWETLLARVHALQSSDARAPAPRAGQVPRGWLTWRGPRDPRRSAVLGEPPALVRELVEELARAAARHAPAAAPPPR